MKLKHFTATLLVLLIIISTAACSPAATNGASASPAPATSAPAAASPSPEATTEASAQPTESAPKDYGQIGNDLITNESFGGVKLGMTESELTAALGKPDTKGEPSVWGADGKNHAVWTYTAKGLTINIAEGDDSKSEYVVYTINAIAPCDLATLKGIKIGSTKDDVMKAYGDAVDPQTDTSAQNMIVAGTMFGGILFGVENDKVTLIFIGAAAE